VVRQLDVNDPSVPERLLASAYGVFMANQIATARFLGGAGPFLMRLIERLLTSDGLPLSHWLSREYVRGMFEAGEKLYPVVLPEAFTPTSVRFIPRAVPEAISATRRTEHEVGGAFRMDFENYTVGRLVPGRGNYQLDHAEYQEVLGAIRGRAWELGWRERQFGELDYEIASSGFGPSEKAEKTDRYGKKYGWIGYYEEAGRQEDAGRLDVEDREARRLPDVDIDPSFPLPPPPLPMRVGTWVATSPAADSEWVAKGAVDVPDRLLRPSQLGDAAGPWLLAYAYLREVNDDLRRDVFGFFHTLLVPQQFVERVLQLLATKPYLGNDFIPREPDSYYTFAGEIPWSDRFSGDTFEVDGYPLYEGTIAASKDDEIGVEIFSHGFAWESYHSVLNDVGSLSVPSASFSRRSDLRALPRSFSQAEQDGSVAAMSFRAPNGFDGHLLYLREDLVREYAADRGAAVVLAAWGERGMLWGGIANPPEWLRAHYATRANLWRRVATLEELGA
jgi:hypothetical protein